MISLAKRVIKQVFGDKRTVLLLIIAPLFIMTLISLLLGESDYRPQIAYFGNNLPSSVISALEEDADLIPINTTDPHEVLRENRDLDAVFELTQTGMTITIYEVSTRSSTAINILQGLSTVLNPNFSVDVDVIVGDLDTPLFQSLGHVFFAVLSFFFIFIVSGMALVRERTSGTLERMLMTPISRRSVVGGYTMGYGFFAICQSIILVLFGIYVLGLNSAGSVALVILIMVLLAVVSVLIGVMISIFAQTEFQIVQMIPVIIVPQIFLSGLIPIEMIPYNLGRLAYVTPIFYGSSAIKEVMLFGRGMQEIWSHLLLLLLFIVVLSVINTIALKRYRQL